MNPQALFVWQSLCYVKPVTVCIFWTKMSTKRSDLPSRRAIVTFCSPHDGFSGSGPEWEKKTESLSNWISKRKFWLLKAVLCSRLAKHLMVKYGIKRHIYRQETVQLLVDQIHRVVSHENGRRLMGFQQRLCSTEKFNSPPPPLHCCGRIASVLLWKTIVSLLYNIFQFRWYLKQAENEQMEWNKAKSWKGNGMETISKVNELICKNDGM